MVFLIVAANVKSVWAEGPYLASEPNTDLQSDAVFQLMIDDQIQSELYSVNQYRVWLDVQDWEGEKTIKARFGNPWPDLPGTYKWSDWSEPPFIYAFPLKSIAPAGMRILSE